MSKRQVNVAEQLRKAIALAERKGQSRYAIAKAAGIRYSMLVRIAEGENLPRIDTAEKLASAIGRRLTLSPN
jgi:transcriptional regulator with XRE-family HTH domain